MTTTTLVRTRIACSSDHKGLCRKMVTINGGSPQGATHRWDTRKGQAFVRSLGWVYWGKGAMGYVKAFLSLETETRGAWVAAHGTYWIMARLAEVKP